MKIAMLEPDTEGLDLALDILSSNGHLCFRIPSDRLLTTLLDEQSVDLVILDWAAPDAVRYETLRWLAKQRPPLRVVLSVTKLTSEKVIVSGLDSGADISIEKPLGNAESLARINALGRNIDSCLSLCGETFVSGEFRFHVGNSSVEVSDRHIVLTTREFRLALLLFLNISRSLTRHQIAKVVWGDDLAARSRTIDTHISSIRKKLGLRFENGYCLKSLYRFGYRLERTLTVVPQL